MGLDLTSDLSDLFLLFQLLKEPKSWSSIRRNTVLTVTHIREVDTLASSPKKAQQPSLGERVSNTKLS